MAEIPRGQRLNMDNFYRFAKAHTLAFQAPVRLDGQDTAPESVRAINPSAIMPKAWPAPEHQSIRRYDYSTPELARLSPEFAQYEDGPHGIGCYCYECH